MTQPSIEELQKELAFYKAKFSLAESDVAVKGYLAYVKIVQEMVKHIENFSISVNIDGAKKDTVMYDRTESIWKQLPDMISSLNRLKMELKIEFNPEEGKPRLTATTPESLLR
jgi:hypothetical protein